MGGGAAGTTHPTGPIVNTSSVNAISFGTGINSGINVLSGGGNIEIRGTSNVNGVSSWSGFTLKATTGSITVEGTSSGTAQGVRIAASGTSTIASAKTNGDAITITGNNTSNSVVANTNGIGIGYSATQVNISATGGGDVRLQGTVTNPGNVASYFNNTNVSTTGGDILVSGDYAELNSTKFDASAGGAVQIKSSHHIGILTSTIETSGPSSGSGGQISLWSDSNGDGVGVIHTAGTVCINSINSCTTATNSGGAEIVLGGGSVAASNSFFPAGGAPSSGSFIGIRLGSANNADQFKLWSGGGDVSVRSRSCLLYTSDAADE